MGRVRASVLGLLVGAVLAAATLLLSDTYSGAAFDELRPAWPRHVGSLFTLPVRMNEPSDLRAYVLPIGLAALLLFAEFSGLARYARARTFERLALAVVLWALVSAAVNGSWELSRGWVFSFTAGAGVAAWLARLNRWNDFVWAAACAATVALIACSASLWHMRSLGAAFVDRPVGPVTLISVLGAAWCAAAASVALCHVALPSARRVAGICLGAGFALLSWNLLQAGGRGAGLLALLAGVCYAATMIVFARLKSARSRWAMLAVIVFCIAAGGMWVGSRLLAPGQTISTRLAARLLYARKMVDLAPQWCAAGCGPDMFVCRMTTALASQRAETPRFLPGNVDLDAHNEWLQAIFELGIVGGVMYLAIPLYVLVLASRAFLRGGSTARRTAILACATGLVAIMAGELVSINLRYPTLAAWYWITIGALLALVNRPRVALRPGSNGRRIAAVLVVGLLVAFAAQDAMRVRAYAAGRMEMGRDDASAVQHLRQGAGRMGAAAWLAGHRDLGSAALNLSRRTALGSTPPATRPTANDEWTRLAIDALRALYDRCPTFPSAGFRLSEALVLAGRADEANTLLGDFLSRVNPYDPQANLLFATIGELSVMDVLDCLRRSLRDSEWQTAMDGHAAAAFQHSELEPAWQQRVHQAEIDLQADDPEKWQDRLAPETLRVEAVRLIYEGRLPEAAMVQLKAVEAYRKLEDRVSTYRRPTRPAVDAALRAGEIVFSIDPAKYRQAHMLVCEAENYAIGDLIRGNRPSTRSHAPGATLVISAVQMPQGLNRLWQVSAALHLAMGEDERETNVRILLSLPLEKRTPEYLETERRRLATQLISVFKSLPETQRPASWPRLMRLSNAASSGQP